MNLDRPSSREINKTQAGVVVPHRHKEATLGTVPQKQRSRNKVFNQIPKGEKKAFMLLCWRLLNSRQDAKDPAKIMQQSITFGKGLQRTRHRQRKMAQFLSLTGKDA